MRGIRTLLWLCAALIGGFIAVSPFISDVLFATNDLKQQVTQRDLHLQTVDPSNIDPKVVALRSTGPTSNGSIQPSPKLWESPLLRQAAGGALVIGTLVRRLVEHRKHRAFGRRYDVKPRQQPWTERRMSPRLEQIETVGAVGLLIAPALPPRAQSRDRQITQ